MKFVNICTNNCAAQHHQILVSLTYVRIIKNDSDLSQFVAQFICATLLLACKAKYGFHQVNGKPGIYPMTSKYWKEAKSITVGGTKRQLGVRLLAVRDQLGIN